MKDPIEERLSKKGETPKWAEDFPVDSEKDTQTARRDFIKYLSLVSLGLFTGQLGFFIKGLWGRKKKQSDLPFRILGNSDLEIGGSYVFRLPEKNESVLLIRLNEKKYVAYSQKCTHLQCPVIWRREESKILCPCHHGAFNAETGDVLYGPPERPLPKATISVREDGVYFEAIEES